MADQNTTVKIDINLESSTESIKKMKETLASAAGEGLSSHLEGALLKKRSEIVNDLQSNIYKYGNNHLKTRANISDLSRNERLLNYVKSQRTKEEEKKTSQEKPSDTYKNQFKTTSSIFTKMHQSLKSLDETGKHSLISLSNIASGIYAVGRMLGPAGLVAGGVIGAAFFALKAVNSAANSILNYSSQAFGSSYTTGELAALLNGKIVNKDVGENIAQSIDANKLTLSSSNRFREAQLAATVTPLMVQFNDKTFNNLRHSGRDESQRQIEDTLFNDIRKTKNVSAALAIGQAYGLSEETVLALNKIKPDVGTQIGQQGNQYKSLNKLTSESFSDTGAISKLAGDINLVAIPAILHFAEVIKNITSNIGGRLHANYFPNASQANGAPGNTAKGIR